MLELLEELDPWAKKVFRKHVHMNELTALSINGNRGQALVMTNRYLYLIIKGFFRRHCRKVGPGELVHVKVEGTCLEIGTTGSLKPYSFHLSREKADLLPSIARRLQQWQREHSPKA